MVRLKLRKEYLNIVTYNTPVLLWIKKLNSLIYRTLYYVNTYGSCKLSKNSPFLAHPVLALTQRIRSQQSIQGRPHGNVHLVMLLYHILWLYDLDADPMTLICDPDPDIMKRYLHTKNEVSMSRLSKVGRRTGQTDRQIQVIGSRSSSKEQ